MIGQRRIRRLTVLAGRFAAHGCIAVATLVFVAQSLGLQIAPTAGKDLHVAFPCMHSRCGCQNAEQCWRGCCCQTLSERLAWAERNNVEPPRFVMQRATDVERDASAVGGDHESKAKSCCRSKKACCEKTAAKPQPKVAKVKSCCSAKQPASKTGKLVEAFRCHGVGENWIGMVPGVAPVIAQHVINPWLIAWTTVESNRPETAHSLPALRPPAV